MGKVTSNIYGLIHSLDKKLRKKWELENKIEDLEKELEKIKSQMNQSNGWFFITDPKNYENESVSINPWGIWCYIWKIHVNLEC